MKKPEEFVLKPTLPPIADYSIFTADKILIRPSLPLRIADEKKVSKEFCFTKRLVQGTKKKRALT